MRNDYFNFITPSKRENDYRLQKLVFDKRMMQQLTKGKRKVIYPFADIIPPKTGDLMYIAEPFQRKFGKKNGLHIQSSVIYLVDGEERVLESDYQTLESDWNCINMLPYGMLEKECRYYIRINKVQTRRFSSLKPSEIIHGNLQEYSTKNINRFHLISFEIVDKNTVEDWYDAIHAEEIFNDLF